MNKSRFNSFLMVLIAILFCLTFYFQVSGLLGLNRDGSNYFLSMISYFRPTYYDSARRFSHYLSQLPFFALLYFGIRDIKTLAYLYSANLFILPLLPVIYFYWKARENENLVIIPLLFLAYFCNFNSLFVISESVAAGSLFILLCGMIFFLENDHSVVEKGVLLLLLVVTFRVYSSFIFFIPILALLLIKKYDAKLRGYYSFLFFILGSSFCYNVYTTINYQYSSIPLSLVLPEYVEIVRDWTQLYYPVGVVVFILTIISEFILEKTNQRWVKISIYIISAILFLYMVNLGIDYLPFFSSSYKNRLSNLYFPILLSILFFLPSKKFLKGHLLLIFVTFSLAFSVYLNAQFKSLYLLYIENMQTKCSQEISFDTTMPKNEKGQFITEFFSLIPDSVLACAFANRPVKTISYVPILTNFFLFDIHKKEAYPDLSIYGVTFEIKNLKLEAEVR
jgi:hypothetical protein